MNRKLLAAAVAGAIGVPTAATAELTINGLLSPSINYVSTFDRPQDTDRVSLEDNQSSIGFKWDEDLGAGTKFIGFIDLSIPIGDPGITGNGGSGVTTRDVYAGFDGGWGKVIFGDASTSWKSSYAFIDPLYRTSAQGRGGIDQVSGLSAGDGKTNLVGTQNSVTRGRASNLVRYDTPSFGGLTGIGWISLEQNPVQDATDVFDGSGYGIGLHYETGPFFASLDWQRDEAIDANGGAKDAFAVGAKFTAEPFAVWGRFEYDGGAISVVEQLGGTKSGIGETKDGHYVYTGVSFNITPNNVLFGTYAHRFESKTKDVPGVGSIDNEDDLDAFLVAIAHGLSKRTWLYAGYGYNNTQEGGVDVTPGRPGDFHIVTAGIKHSF
ncbi:MAG: porin [Gammaproteobacteria bacterium]